MDLDIKNPNFDPKASSKKAWVNLFEKNYKHWYKKTQISIERLVQKKIAFIFLKKLKTLMQKIQIAKDFLKRSAVNKAMIFWKDIT